MSMQFPDWQRRAQENRPYGARHFVAAMRWAANPAMLAAMRKPPTPAFTLVDVSIVLALAIVAVVGYKYSPLLLPGSDLTVAPTTACDLNKTACGVDVPGGGHIELDISPRPIPVVKPLTVNANLTDIDADKVEIDFAGADMNMGYNRVALAAAGDGHFSGSAMIPVCVTGRMAWRATLVVDTGRRRIAVPFEFEAPVGGH